MQHHSQTRFSQTISLLLIAVLSIATLFLAQSDALAQSDGRSVEEWAMTYQLPDGQRLTGIAKRSGGTVSLKWTQSDAFPGAHAKLDSAAPFEIISRSKSDSGTEIVFEAFEFLARAQNQQLVATLDGKRLTEQEYVAFGSKFSDENFLAAHWSDYLLITSLMGDNVAAYGAKGAYVGGVSAHARAGFGAGGGIVGSKLRLFNPSVSEDGGTIIWDWEAQIGKDDTLIKVRKASGSKEAGNPIVWGPTSEITHIFVVNDQSGLKEKNRTPLYPVVTSEVRKENDEATITAMNARELVVIGRDLGRYRGEGVLGAEPILTYSQLREFEPGFVAERLAGYDLNAVDKETLRKIEAVLANDTSLEAHWVTATINLPAKPLLVPLSVGKSRGQWALDFGDNAALLAIVKPQESAFLDERQSGSELRQDERLGMELHFRDEVVFDLRLKTEIDLELLEITFEGENVILGKDHESGSAASITLRRMQGDKKQYRSRSYVLADRDVYKNEFVGSSKRVIASPNEDGSGQETELPGGDVYADIPPDQLLLARQDEWLRPRLPQRHRIRLIHPLPDQQIMPIDETVSGDFIAALKRSTICAANESRFVGTDWDRLSLEQASEIAYGIWNQTSIPITHGQHAAMILVGNAFLKRATDNLKQIEATLKDPQGPAFKTAAIHVWEDVPSLVNTLARSPRTGMVIDLDFMRRKSASLANASGGMRSDFRNRFQEMLRQQAGHMRASISYMKKQNICDVRSLISLVGRGFEPIIAQLQKSVTRLHKNERTGIRVRRPDTVAIRELRFLPTTFEQNKLASELDEAQTETINAMASAIGLVSGLSAAYHGTAWAAYVSLAADGLDFASTCSEHVCGYLDNAEKARFGKSASSLIGTTIADDAAAEAQSPWSRAAQLGISSASLKTSAFDAYAHILKKAPAGGLKELAESMVSLGAPGDVKDAIGTGTYFEQVWQTYLVGEEQKPVD